MPHPTFYRAPFFGPDASFRAYGAQHGVVLVIAAVVFGLAARYARRGDAARQQRMGNVFGWLPLGVWATFNVFRSITGDWTKQVDLPLNLCPLMAFVLPFVLTRVRSHRAFEVAYFFVLAGCIQALLTPNLREGWPHYEFVRYWLLHVSLVWAVLYAIVVYGERPTMRGLGLAAAAFVAYIAVVKAINTGIGTNYAFTQRKPDTASLLDHLGPYPLYIFTGTLMALALFVLVYAPVALAGHRQRRRIRVA